MKITLKRAYDKAARNDGYRVLVDRIWPRGIAKEDAHIDEWLKDIAPSSRLRKWFAHDPDKWDAFRKQYVDELNKNPDPVRHLRAILNKRHITLVYAAKDERMNNAVVLKDYLEKAVS